MFLNVDFLAGCLTGALLIPALVRLWNTGHIDGWHIAPYQKPDVGETVLAWDHVDNDYRQITYHGPDGGGAIPETARFYWRRFPRPPLSIFNDN